MTRKAAMYSRSRALSHDRRRDRRAIHLDADIRIRVVEADRGAHIGAVRDGRGRDELGQVHEPGEIHALARGQGLDPRAIALRGAQARPSACFT